MKEADQPEREEERSPGVKALLSDLCTDDPVARERARQALTSLGPDILEPLAGLREHRDPLVRWEVARVLGGIPSEEAARLLVGLLDDEAEDVRNAAAESLRRQGERGLIPLLEALATREDLGFLRASALRALAPMKGLSDTLDTLLEALAGGAPETSVHLEAHRALEDLKKR